MIDKQTHLYDCDEAPAAAEAFELASQIFEKHRKSQELQKRENDDEINWTQHRRSGAWKTAVEIKCDWIRFVTVQLHLWNEEMWNDNEDKYCSRQFLPIHVRCYRERSSASRPKGWENYGQRSSFHPARFFSFSYLDSSNRSWVRYPTDKWCLWMTWENICHVWKLFYLLITPKIARKRWLWLSWANATLMGVKRKANPYVNIIRVSQNILRKRKYWKFQINLSGSVSPSFGLV